MAGLDTATKNVLRMVFCLIFRPAHHHSGVSNSYREILPCTLHGMTLDYDVLWSSPSEVLVPSVQSLRENDVLSNWLLMWAVVLELDDIVTW